MSGYKWDQTNYLCGKNCTGVTNTNGEFDINNVEQCVCVGPTYQWNSQNERCERICTPSTTNHKNGLDANDTTYTVCLC